ncbi:hypothetical protein EDD16DRAFT_1520844 [Pisolithus croceorrhizus]|nr:hypothetical protein EDD16DRAFT_1520844 [Pisolithus croceorrhizus]
MLPRGFTISQGGKMGMCGYLSVTGGCRKSFRAGFGGVGSHLAIDRHPLQPHVHDPPTGSRDHFEVAKRGISGCMKATHAWCWIILVLVIWVQPTILNTRSLHDTVWRQFRWCRWQSPGHLQLQGHFLFSTLIFLIRSMAMVHSGGGVLGERLRDGVGRVRGFRVPGVWVAEGQVV